jgi:hypothetical protein
MAFSWRGNVYVVKENFNPESAHSAEAIVHELEHIVQEKHFDLKDDGSYDGKKAVGAIIEGDAVLAGRLYAGRNISEMDYYEVDEENCLNFLYLFPYKYGIRFLADVYIREGYEGVDRILKNPPLTTEQILHNKNESFREVENDKLSGILVKKDRLGELLVFVFLAAHINDSIAYRAAEGWDGDSYVLYRDSGFRWQWKILWDDEKDAQEFYCALEDMLELIAEPSNNAWIISGDFLEQRLKIALLGNMVIIEGESF